MTIPKTQNAGYYEQLFFKIISFIYITVLFMIVPLGLIGNLLVGIGGHNKPFTLLDYLIFVFAWATSVTLSLYIIDTDENKAKSKLLFPIVMVLVMTSIVFQIASQFKAIFFDHTFKDDGILVNTIFTTFILISILVSIGLFRERKRISLNNS